MKKNSLITLLLSAIFGSSLSAQTPLPVKPVKTGNEWKMPADVFKRSQAFASGLQKKLGLDSIQTKKVYNAFLANTKSVDEISLLPEEEKKAKMKINKTSFDEILKGILLPAQYDKYLARP